MQFDIVDFYPSITENLLMDAINYAAQHTDVSDKDIEIIMHARKSLLFNKDEPWIKKTNDSTFDVTMGSYDGAEACELVGLYILPTLQDILPDSSVGLYRDDGLGALHNLSAQALDRKRKDVIEHFRKIGLKITIEVNLKTVNFLDITLDLTNETYKPYHKPNDNPLYIHASSNHPQASSNNYPKTSANVFPRSRRLKKYSTKPHHTTTRP
jgi:hypothetical protein